MSMKFEKLKKNNFPADRPTPEKQGRVRGNKNIFKVGLNEFIYIPSKQITYCYNSSLYASCRFVGWDSYIFFNIEQLSKSLYIYDNSLLTILLFFNISCEFCSEIPT